MCVRLRIGFVVCSGVCFRSFCSLQDCVLTAPRSLLAVLRLWRTFAPRGPALTAKIGASSVSSRRRRGPTATRPRSCWGRSVVRRSWNSPSASTTTSPVKIRRAHTSRLSARRRQSSPTPGAAQFRRQSKFDAPILQGCSARRRQPSATPGAAQFRRQSKFAAPILQDCSARRRQPSPTPGAAHFRRQSKFEALKLQDSGGMWSLRDVHVLRNCVNAHMRQQHCSSSSDLFSIVKP